MISKLPKLVSIGLATSLLGTGLALGEPDPGAHQGKKILHNSTNVERPYMVCNRNEDVRYMKVYVGRNARAVEVRYGECKEFKAKQISVDEPPKKERAE